MLHKYWWQPCLSRNFSIFQCWLIWYRYQFSCGPRYTSHLFSLSIVIYPSLCLFSLTSCNHSKKCSTVDIITMNNSWDVLKLRVFIFLSIAMEGAARLEWTSVARGCSEIVGNNLKISQHRNTRKFLEWFRRKLLFQLLLRDKSILLIQS